jgi:hypothetical protein
MQHAYVMEPLLPLNAPNGVIEGKPLTSAGAPATNHASPRAGSYVYPQTTLDRFAVQCFAAERGMTVFTLYGSWRFDAMLYDVANDRVLKVVVEDRWTIDRRYLGLSDIWIVFRINDELYWMPHDEMVRAAEADGISWNTHGSCSRSRLSASMHSQCAPYRVTPESGTYWLAMPTLSSSR